MSGLLQMILSVTQLAASLYCINRHACHIFVACYSRVTSLKIFAGYEILPTAQTTLCNVPSGSGACDTLLGANYPNNRVNFHQSFLWRSCWLLMDCKTACVNSSASMNRQMIWTVDVDRDIAGGVVVSILTVHKCVDQESKPYGTIE